VGVNRGQEAAPIVAGDTMYVLTPYPNILDALDLTRAGAPLDGSASQGRMPPPGASSAANTVNRGPIFADGRIAGRR
jgi:lanthanide-dependent methanol dehydrogenase